MLVVPLHFAQVVHKFTLSGDPEPFIVTHGVEVADPPVTATTPRDLAHELYDMFVSNVLPHTSSAISYQGAEIRWQTSAPPLPPTIGDWIVPVAGGNTGAVPLVPQNTAFLVHKRTALAGRRGRGRLYHPGVAEGQVDNIGVVTPATALALGGGYEAYRAAVVAHADFVSLVVFHDDDSLSVLPAPTPVTSMVCDARVGTQRRRLRR